MRIQGAGGGRTAGRAGGGGGGGEGGGGGGGYGGDRRQHTHEHHQQHQQRGAEGEAEEVVDDDDDEDDAAGDHSEDEDEDDNSEDSSWISWFVNLKGNEFFCELEEDYIQDGFNLTGLSSEVPYFNEALDMILDIDTEHDHEFTEEQHDSIEAAAEMLYGLIHARYILTGHGLADMHDKFKRADFGRCRRVFCEGQPVLPVGQSDRIMHTTVNVYCPRCRDIYFPASKRQGNIDGAFFGRTFPHLFLMTYPELIPHGDTAAVAPARGHGAGGGGGGYVPRVFGFRIAQE
eukprot:g3630.t1